VPTAGFAGFHGYGLGASFSDYETFFKTGKAGDTYTDPTGLVYCKKDKIGSPECRLVAFPPGTRARKGPVADLQKATDELLAKIPVYNLEGAKLRLVVPNPDGGTIEETRTMPMVPSDPGPIYIESDKYDGILGARTRQWVLVGAVLAAALKKPPDDAITALVAPHRADLITMQSAGIAAYFRNVAANFDALLKAYKNRGMKPAATPLAPETIEQIILAPKFARIKKRRPGLVVGASLAAAGLLGLGVAALASRKKPKGKTPLLPEEMF
jgi:hypothetical protein